MASLFKNKPYLPAHEIPEIDFSDDERDIESEVSEMLSKIDDLLPVGHCSTVRVMEQWAMKIVDGQATLQEAIQSLTSTKPIIRKK